MAGALTGITVLDLTRLLPGPYCTMLMAVMGARVIKVEDPNGGDPARVRAGEPDNPAFYTLNRNKEGVAINFKAPGGREAFLRLSRRADVVMEGFRPGVAARLGIDYPAVQAVNPQVVYCSISGYGQDGPYRDLVGHDINYMALVGALGIGGPRDGAPALTGVQVADIGGGSLMALSGVLAALLHRQRTGEGQYLDVAMADGVISWLTTHAAAHFASGQDPQREGLRLNGLYPCYNVYRCADGGYITIGAVERHFWLNLCRHLGRPDLEERQFDPAARTDLAAVFATRGRDQWFADLAPFDVCVAPVNTFSEAFRDPHVLHRQMVLPEDRPLMHSLGFPIKFSRTPPKERRPAPTLGEHTAAVLTEAGYTATELAALRQAGAIPGGSAP